MLIKEYSRHLEMLAQEGYVGSYLEEGSKHLLIERAKILNTCIRKNKKGHAEWRILISREKPLTFIKSDVDNLKLQVDISCEIEGIGDEIKKHNILLRVWSLDEKISYRDDMDAVELKNKLECLGWRRVMLRIHFDRRDKDVKKPEPLHHLQMGGDPKDDENCWFPKQIKVPRFPNPPIDLILLFELVLMNFFPIKSEQLRKKPEWKGLVRKSQEIFLRPYLTKCIKHLDNKNNTLLGHLTN